MIKLVGLIKLIKLIGLIELIEFVYAQDALYQRTENRGQRAEIGIRKWEGGIRKKEKGNLI
jgi:hypothetical protein